MKAIQARDEVPIGAGRLDTGIGLALVRLTIGAMFVWVFFENLGKGAYTPPGYGGLINYYIKQGHAPASWKAVMGLMASHAAMAAPLQALTEISLGILLLLGLVTRPVALIALPSSRPSNLFSVGGCVANSILDDATGAR